MKRRINTEKAKEIRKEIHKIEKQIEKSMDNDILESLDKEALAYVHMLFRDYYKEDIDKKILKDIVLLSQYSNDVHISDFLAETYGVETFLDMLGDLGFDPEEWRDWFI